MAATATKFGVVLPNRGLALGTLHADEIFDLAELADSASIIDSVWIGDSIISKPRLECVALMSALGIRTHRVRIGVACLATFVQRHPLLFALQWGSVDVIAKGRTVLAVCLGYPADYTEDAARELRAMGVTSADRPALLVENIEILRKLWGGGEVVHQGQFYQFDQIRLDVRPVQQPYPIWIASNPQEGRLSPMGLERALRRVAKHADGWMTTVVSPEEFARRWARIQVMATDEGRNLDSKATVIIYNLNVNHDREAAEEETRRFLRDYYRRELSAEMIKLWCAWGPAEECAAKLQHYVDTDAGSIIVRMCSWNQHAQIRQYIEEVLPRIRRRVSA